MTLAASATGTVRATTALRVPHPRRAFVFAARVGKRDARITGTRFAYFGCAGVAGAAGAAVVAGFAAVPGWSGLAGFA